MLDLKRWMTKVTGMFSDIVHYDRQVSTSYAAGTIGTRAAQVSFDNPAPYSYYIRSILITDISDSASFHPLVFYSGGKFYVNFYRASTTANNAATVSLRIVYTKTIWGGTVSTVFSRLSAILGRFSRWEVA